MKWRLLSFDFLTLKLNPSRPYPERIEKINLDLYFHTSLWCLKRFYEGLKAFEAPKKSVKIKL